ncbi:MAG: molecular chaperone TorD family protein [Nitrospirota bacterium]|nr:molecular chaperone TorD family protein [Nitrospirota bacterium]
MDIEQFVKFERARSDCYKLLAACFYQPQKAMLLDENVFAMLGDLLTRICPDAELFSKKMAESLMRYDEEALLVEYARLFLGPNELLAPPYGAVYLDKGGILMGESTAKAVDFYKAEGLSMDQHYYNLPDHITAELEFMHYLTYREVEALEKNDTEKARYCLDRREAFMLTCLGSWVAPFCEKIKQGTDNEFYRALADCLSVFLSKTGHCEMPVELQESLARV